MGITPSQRAARRNGALAGHRPPHQPGSAAAAPDAAATPPAGVWAALTTAEGLGTRFGNEATIDLRPAGPPHPGCPACSATADGFNGFAIHLANHDVMLWAVSRAPLERLQGYKQRMGWSFPRASSFGSDLNDDFDVSLTEEQERAGAFEYNFRESPVWSPPEDVRGPFDAWAATTGRPIP